MAPIDTRDRGHETCTAPPHPCFASRVPCPDRLKGGSPQENASIALSILKGTKGPQRDIVVLNAAALFLLADRVKGWHEGLDMAARTIDSRKAEEKLKQLVQFTNAE